MAATGDAELIWDMPFAALLVDPTGRIRGINAAAEALSGWSAAEAIGLPVATLVPGIEPSTIGAGAHATIVRCRGGRDRSVACTCWRIGSAEPLVGMILDDRAPADGELLTRLATLAPGIANEVNTPMQYIGDNARFLLEAINDVRGIVSWYRACLRVLAKERHAGLVEEISSMERKIGLDALLDDIPAAILQSLDGVKRVTMAATALKEFAEARSEATAVDMNQAISIALALSQNQWKSRVDMVFALGDDTPRVWCVPRSLLFAMLDLIQAASTWSATAGATVRVATRRQGEHAVLEFFPGLEGGEALMPSADPLEPCDLARARAAIAPAGGGIAAEIGAAGWRFTATFPAFRDGVQGRPDTDREFQRSPAVGGAA